MRRRPSPADGDTVRQADVTRRADLESLLGENPHQIVLALSPDNHSREGYENCYLAAVDSLLSCTQKLGVQPEVLFISSTSVYGQNAGEQVNERSTCHPARFNGRILREAEVMLSESPIPSTCIRFSGIYGPGKFRMIKSSLVSSTDPGALPHWTNRIHAQDCARTICHILDMPADQREGIYLASDAKPTARHEVQNWIRTQFSLKPLPEPDASGQSGSTGKRCDNSLLTQSGFEFQYPSYLHGMPEIIDTYRSVQRADGS